MEIENNKVYTLMTYDIDGNDSNANRFVKEYLMRQQPQNEVGNANENRPRVWYDRIERGGIRKKLPESTLIAEKFQKDACEQFERACKQYNEGTTGIVCCVAFVGKGCIMRRI